MEPGDSYVLTGALNMLVKHSVPACDHCGLCVTFSWRYVRNRVSPDGTDHGRFAIVNDNSVAVLLEAFGTPADHAQHLERPEVKEHIERINEKAQIWKVDPLSFD